MTTTTTELLPNYLDVTKLAVTGFLARYRQPTLGAYTLDLRTFLAWCRSNELEMLRVSRAELEMYVRHLESRGHAPATVARRFGTVATFLKYAVIDELIPANPAVAVTRPKVNWEGQKRTVLHPLEFAAMLTAARSSSPTDHALVCMLGMLGLRVSEACNADITDIRYESGHELLHVIGKRRQTRRHSDAHPGPARREGSHRRSPGGPDPAQPHRTTDGSRRGQPSTDAGRACRWGYPSHQPARTAPHLLHHRARRRDLHPGHAVRDAAL
jgi:site-specific recombinase XerC